VLPCLLDLATSHPADRMVWRIGAGLDRNEAMLPKFGDLGVDGCAGMNAFNPPPPPPAPPVMAPAAAFL
jgi:hypothetical protein